MNVAPVTSRQETPIWFDVGDEWLFGIHTRATEQARGVGVIVASSGGTPLSTSVNDLSVRLCRTISAYGFDGFRFDYHGVGESTGTVDRFHLAEPFVLDMEGAVKCLRGRGIERFVLVGSCFGARTVLAAAPHINGVAAVILISPPVRDFEMGERVTTRVAEQLSIGAYLRRAIKPRTLAGLMKVGTRRTYARYAKQKFRQMVRFRTADAESPQGRYRTSPRFLGPLRAVADREVPISIIFGDDDDLFEDFERAKVGPLGKALESAAGGVEFTKIPGKIHGFSSIAAQDRVLDLITDRLVRLPHS